MFTFLMVRSTSQIAMARAICSLVYSFRCIIRFIMAAIPPSGALEEGAEFFIASSILWRVAESAPIFFATASAFSGLIPLAASRIFFRIASLMLLEGCGRSPFALLFIDGWSCISSAAAIIIDISPSGLLREASVSRASASSSFVMPAVRHISSSVAIDGRASNWVTRLRAGVRYRCVNRVRCFSVCGSAFLFSLSSAKRL